MAHTLYRHRECFQKPNAGLDLFKNIPFLNGGLFECLDKVLGEKTGPRYMRVDGYSRRPDSQPVVPDFLFFGPEHEVDLSADYGEAKYKRVKVRGLIHTFDRYKFTVTENTPIEEEIALDPELSGNVFENLLAAYNPETGATARKQTGSFFTPREIVNYMVDEALVAYLQTELETSQPSVPDVEARLRHLFAYNDQPHGFAAPEVDILIAAIDRLKSLDPAVGSGAFPMGILHKLVFILGKLDPNNERWRERQRRRAISETEEAFRIGNKEERGRRLEDINEVFEQNSSDYGRKLYLIENCIYGVDIQPIAVQIAKMRFFISLIVDQKTDPKAPNLGVRPLPNLETKFVAANTLISINRPQQIVLRDPSIVAKEAELRLVRQRHFLARTPATKNKYREQDAALRAEIADLLRAYGTDPSTSRKLAAWDPYDQNASAEFFDAEWMFGLREGFHITIGNPPYVRIQTLNQTDAEQAAWLKLHYASARKGNYDLYVVFVERSLQLLNPHGQLAFILPHKFFNAQYGQPLRSLLSKGKHLRHVVHFGDQQVFPGATNYVCLLFLAKAGADSCRFVRANDLPVWLADRCAAEAVIPVARVTDSEWNFAAGKGAGLFEKLRQMPMKLGVVADLFVGLQTDADDVFIVEQVDKSKGELICHSKHTQREHRFEIDHLKAFLKGSLNIRRYELTDVTKKLIFPYEICDGTSMLIAAKDYQDRFPLTWAYLRECKARLSTRANGKFNDFWHGYVYKKNHIRFEQVKLLVPAIGKGACFAADIEGKYYFVGSGGGGGGGCGITLTADTMISSLYVLGLVNSRLLDWYLRQISTPFRGGYMALNRQYIEQLPLCPINFSDKAERAMHDALVGLVDRILKAKRTNPSADTIALERDIDERVYRLYALTPEEIKIVEESAK